MLPGLYIEADTYVEVALSLARPLRSDLGSPAATTRAVRATLRDEGASRVDRPFTRLVVVCDGQRHARWIESVRDYVSEANAAACDLVSLAPDDLAAALETYVLSEDELQDGTLDVITGVRTVFPDEEVLILEGPPSGSIHRWEPQPFQPFQCNPSLECPLVWL